MELGKDKVPIRIREICVNFLQYLQNIALQKMDIQKIIYT